MFGKPVACRSRSAAATVAPNQRTTRPIMTGTTVLGIVYDKGVLLASDTLLSYGSMAKNQNVPRLKRISHAECLLGASGEYSDFQSIVELLERKALEQKSTGLMESIYETKSMNALQIWNYLRFVMYNRRNKFNPYWNELVVAGTHYKEENGSSKLAPFLGTIDKIGTTIRDENIVATGFGSYLATPYLREQWRPDLTEGEARALLEDTLKILFFRDCRASARVQLAKAEVVTSDDDPTAATTQLIVSDPYDLDIPNAAWDTPALQQVKGNLDDPTACGF